MARFLKGLNGLARGDEVPGVSSSPVYNEVINVASTITAGTSITLPNSGDYTDKELMVFLNGKFLQLTDGWNTVGSAPRTQVTFTEDLVDGDLVSFVKIKEL